MLGSTLTNHCCHGASFLACLKQKNNAQIILIRGFILAQMYIAINTHDGTRTIYACIKSGGKPRKSDCELIFGLTLNLCTGVRRILDLSGFYHEWNANKLIIKPDFSPLVK